MGRGSVTGPALGGTVCFHLDQKAAAAAGAADMDALLVPVPGFLLFASMDHVVANGNGTDTHLEAKDTSLHSAYTSTALGLVNNEGKGTGGLVVARAFTESARGARTLAAGDEIAVNVAGASATALSYGYRVFVAVQGHRYTDPVND